MTGEACGNSDYAVSGKAWTENLRRGPQNYLLIPKQPWLDGYVVEEGLIRQFVAMPLGAGYTAEEQITGKAEHGGLQLAVYPMKREAFERHFPERKGVRMRAARGMPSFGVDTVCACMSDMGLAPGGRMRQEIYKDTFANNDWETDTTSRCFVHLCNSLVWQAVTGSHPPHPAPTPRQYTSAGLPWPWVRLRIMWDRKRRCERCWN